MLPCRSLFALSGAFLLALVPSALQAQVTPAAPTVPIGRLAKQPAKELMRYRSGIRTSINRYDTERDEIIHYEGVLVKPRHRPGGDISYYGNRLTQYQWLGAPNRGGVYDAMELYKRDMNLKRRNYQYRW